jgi:small subunit ribosomal protein S3
VDYGQATAFTTYGTIGVKCWLHHGEIEPGKMAPGPGEARAPMARRERAGAK